MSLPIRILACCCLIVLWGVFVDAASYDYAITIDAGSTGSRFYIYQWEHRHASGSIPPFSLPITEAGWSKNIKPGISSFESHPNLQDITNYFKPFLMHAQEKMHEISAETPLDKVPITLKATAGMRIIANITTRDTIMDLIREVFLDKEICPFAFDPAMGARIISGEEEGLFGWIAVNRIMSTLLPPPGEHAHTWGALDLGGASTQITFDPSTQLLANSFALDIPTHPYLLYTHSFLWFGMEQVVFRIQDTLYKQRQEQPIVIHPCLPLNYTPWAIVNGTNMTFIGSSNVTGCRSMTYDLLSKNSPCFSSPSPDACSFAGVYQPILPPNMKFVAFSSFGYIIQNSGLGENGTMERLSQLTTEICSLNYTSLSTFYNISGSRVELLCLNMTYALTLLHDGYGFPIDNTSRIIFANQINNISVEWPLGATLYDVNALAYDIDISCNTNNNDIWYRWIPLIIASLLVVLAMIICIKHYYTKQQQQHMGHHDEWETSHITRHHDDEDVEEPFTRDVRGIEVAQAYR